VQQKSDNTFSDIDGAEVLLELGNIYRQEFAVEVDISEETPKFEKIFVDAGTQTDNHKELKNVEVQVNTSWSSISDFIQTEKALNILTGLSSFSLLFLLMKLFPLSKKDSRCQRVSVKNRILLVFLKFKLDMTYSALGVFFGGISVPTCRKIFQDTVEVLSDILVNFVYLPPKQDVLKNIPLCVQKYQNVRIVAANCTGIKVQVPKNSVVK
jgi:hypothetical protein